jgi:hypothetical protein
MNERILVGLRCGGRALAVDALGAAGVVLEGETDAWPRRLEVSLRGATRATTEALRFVRQRLGWPSGHFELTMERFGARLALSGVRQDPPARRPTLPPGRYRLGLRIDDLVPRERRGVEFVLAEGEDRLLDLEFDEKAIHLRPLGEALTDARLWRVLADPRSRLDGLPLLDWLASPRPRAARKACVLNLLARLRVVPSPAAPLLDHVQAVFFADADRLYALVAPALRDRLEELSEAGDGPGAFGRDAGPPHPVHRKVEEAARARLSGAPAAWEPLRSYRERASPALQLVVAQAPSPGQPCVADVDIDLGNPLLDLRGAVVHLGELLDPRKTDHLDLRGTLARNAALAPFLCYDLA